MLRFTVKYSSEALQEIKQAVDYYNKLSDGLGDRFKQNLLAAVKAAKLNPTYNSFRYDDVRFTVVKKFPYATHYTIDQDIHIVKYKPYCLLAKILIPIGRSNFNFNISLVLLQRFSVNQ